MNHNIFGIWEKWPSTSEIKRLTTLAHPCSSDGSNAFALYGVKYWFRVFKALILVEDKMNRVRLN